MDLKQYFYILQRWAWLIIIGMILGAAGGYIASSYQIPVFQASTKLLFSRPADDQINNYMYLTDQQIAQTYMQLLNTQPVLDAASKLLGYSVDSGQVDSDTVRDTQLIMVTVEDSDPVHAADIANTLINVLIEQSEKLQSSRFASSESSLKAQLTQVEGQIAELQSEIAMISEESYSTQKNQIEAQIKKLEDDILKVQQEINIINPPRQMDMYGRYLPGPTLSVEETSLLQEKQLRLEQLQSSLEFYQQIYLNLVGTGKNPVVTSDSATRLDQMNNTLALYQQIYSNLLSSYEEVRLSRMRTTPNIVQVEMAVPPDSPIRPRPFNNAGLGGLVGLMLAAGIVLLVEYLDDTLKSSEEVTRLFQLPVIGYVAEMNLEGKDKDTIYVSSQPRSPVSESFRTLRTNIEFSSVDKPPKTILVTSANPSEGKTTTAVNLAVALAQGGKKVTLIDADLRRPHVHKYFNLSNRMGLSDVFLHNRTYQAVARPWKDNGQLMIVTSGSLPPNPAELLTSDRMMQFINAAIEQSDIVVLDSPPFLVSDASVLAARVDGVILVVQPGHTHTDAIKVMIDQLQRVGAKTLGLVFNRIPKNRSYYYGGYRHYKGYYYSGSKSYDQYYYGADGQRKRPAKSSGNGNGSGGNGKVVRPGYLEGEVESGEKQIGTSRN